MSEKQTPVVKKRFSIGGLFRSNRFTAVFSIVASVIIWFTVSVAFNPTSERDILNVPVQIPVSATAAGDLKVYEGADTTVSVRVSGKKYVVDQLSADDVVVTADISDVVGVGSYTLALSARSGSGLADYDVLSISPSSVTVTLDNEATKTFDVEVKCNGVSVTGNYGNDAILAVEPEVADDAYDTLTVTGAASRVQRIDRVVAVADVNEELEESKRVTGRIVLYDADDGVLYDSQSGEETAAPGTLSFTEVPIIARINMIRDLPLRVNYRNAPAQMPPVSVAEVSAYGVVGAAVSAVRVKGEPATVAPMAAVTLDGNFDCMSLDPDDPSSWYKDFSLPVLSGVSYVNYTAGNLSFRVSLDPDELAVKTFEIPAEQITVDNAAAFSVAAGIKNLRVIGPAQELRSLNSDGIAAVVDATGLAVGSHVLRPTFRIPSQSHCWVAGSYEVTVSITE